MWSTTALCLLLLSLPGGQETAPGAPPEVIQRRLGAMGTWLDVEVAASSRSQALAASEAAVRAIEAVEARLSTWTTDSELAQFNAAPAGEPQAISTALRRDLELCLVLHAQTDGAFDPGVGHLVAAWGLRSGGRQPSAAELAACLAGEGFSALVLGEGTAVRPEGLLLEEGAFGKGAGLDAAREALEASGARWATIDLGGQVLVFGQRRSVRLGVADPRDRERIVLELEVERGSLATSGNSERGILVDGQRRSHILDPGTGAPAADFGSLTVWAQDATRADALSTALFVLGPERALDWAARHEGVEVLVLQEQDGRLHARTSAGLGTRLHPRVEDLDVLPLPPQAMAPRRDPRTTNDS